MFSTKQQAHSGAWARRRFIAGLMAMIAALCFSASHAQAIFPGKPVTLVVPFPPGAIVDNVGRKLAAKLADIWKVSVVIENKPGAGGNLAGGIVAGAKPDGYTLLLSQYDSMVIAKAGGLPIGYDPQSDLLPVAQVGLSTTLFLVNADSKLKTFKDFIEYAKSNPGKLNFGSNGFGGSYHLGIEQLNSVAGVSIVHVPYKGGSPSMIDLLSNRVDAILASTSLAQPQMKAGKVRALALGSARRSALYPGVLPIAESGYPQFDVSLGLGVFAPAGVSKEVINKINQDVNTALSDPLFKDQLNAEGVDATEGTPGAFQKIFSDQITATRDLLQRLNLKLE
ncbi:tripartite tricarboxylate transporter substrate binding protein [Pollutimonas sp. H1-120]|uniref:Bug family tripartite tricarboxylate transporter substrate binding protein n=1 Tax=Pollutimonas sp. H1-120 TaxID=3148824 RepID=UPI003B52376C